MAEVNWELLILIIIVGLIVFAALGIFVGTRISSDKRRIRELEEELAETKKDLEIYRSRVNSHFKKTSELFTQMTDSYRAIYMHLAQGSQELCTTDAALLKPANEEFLKVTHEEKKDDKQQQPAAEKAQEETAAPDDLAEQAAAEITPDEPDQVNPEETEMQEEQKPADAQQEGNKEEVASSADKEEERKEP